MEPLEILKAVKSLESNDIYDLLYSRGVDISYDPNGFCFTNKDARIITNTFGQTTIFLKLRPGENPKYEIYLLWHEFGHMIVEGRMPGYRHHSLETSGKAGELDADIFASLALIQNMEEITTNDIEALANEIGAPYDVLDDVIITLALDIDFMDYIFPSEE